LLDGEVVVYGPDGLTDFQALQNAFRDGKQAEMTYVVFDLPYIEGHRLIDVPLEQRKELLFELLKNRAPPQIKYSEHVIGSGPQFFEEAKKLGVEGIISKPRQAPYRSGRAGQWLKVKAVNRQEFVIGGYTAPS